jgi:hypothetical protein
MQVKTMGNLKQLVNDHGMTVNDDGVAQIQPSRPGSVLPVAPPNMELLQAVRELTAAVQAKEPPIVVQSPVPDRPQRWVFTVERNFEGITRIVAEAK